MRSSNETLIRALRILTNDIKSDDGVAQAAIFEGAQRIEELMDRIKRLEEAGDDIFLLAQKHAPEYWLYTQTAFNNWKQAKEAKP